MTKRLTLLTICAGSLCAGSLAGCAKEPPPRSVLEFEESPILLEAAILRCAQDRSGTRYDAECVNAREAAAKLEARDEAARKADLEARSARKRRALRRTQEAAARARRRAAEERRAREEGDYLAQFGEPLADGEESVDGAGGSNMPIAAPGDDVEASDSSNFGTTIPATDGGNAPVADPAPDDNSEDGETDLESIRDELRRRNENEGDVAN